MTDRDEVKFELRKALVLYGDDASEQHRWLSEADRWQELVFALLTQIHKGSEAASRSAVSALFALGLIQIDELVKADQLTPVFQRHFTDVLKDVGFTPEEADRSFRTVCDAANALAQRFDGRVQRFLRHYGELLLKELTTNFAFSSLGDGEVANAFTYWLQNVANMPLSLRTVDVSQFCVRNNVDENTLILIADELDVNLAFLDDVLAYDAKERQ